MPPKLDPIVNISPWQSRQAAMLYHYASLDYLKKLFRVVTHLIEGVADPLLAVAANQQRDSLLKNSIWGGRNTSENWANYAWPFLKEMQTSLAKNIALRAFDQYKVTEVSECLRGAEQFSMQWATEAEEKQYLQTVELVNSYAGPIDKTLYPRVKPRWSDFGFYSCFAGFKAECPRIPKFRVRSDLTAETGRVPPRTGVYISADDPHAILQFATAGNDGIKLRDASTFSQLGLEVLAAVGRNDLWFNEKKMFDFAINSKHLDLIRNTMEVSGQLMPSLASAAIANHAVTTHPSTWCFIEVIPDEFENVDFPPLATEAPALQIRLTGGETCSSSGYYFSPAHPNSRRYVQSGQTMPVLETQYGETIWQLDQNQSD
jgi:hypothetical protein